MDYFYRCIPLEWAVDGISAALWPLIIVVLTCLITFVLFFASPESSSGEPPMIPYLIPFVGHAFEFIRDQRGFYERANTKSKGEPFSMLMAGQKYYIFHTPDDVSRVFRKSSTLADTREGQVIFRQNILGFSRSDAEKVADLRSEEGKIHAMHLLSAEELDKNMTKFCEEMDLQLEQLERVVARRTGVILQHEREDKMDAFELVGNLMIKTTVAALFGHEAFEDYVGLFGDLQKFLTDKFFLRVVGLPSIFSWGAVQARERIKARLAKVIDELDCYKDMSGYIQQRVKILGGLGVKRAGVISNEFDIILGSNLNSIPIAYLTLLHLLSDPNLMASIRTELKTTSFLTLPSSSHVALLPARYPRLQALLREVMRYHTTASSTREVRADTVLDLKTHTYTLRKGALVTLPSSLLHYDPRIHPNPEVFDAERFLASEVGGKGTPATANTLRPFGGGAGYCPGRRFAEGQIMAVIAGLVERFEFEVLTAMKGEKERLQIPRNADFFFVTKCRQVEIVAKRRVG